MRAMLAHHAAPTERSQQLGRAIKIRHFDVRGAYPLRIMRVGANSRRKRIVLREQRCFVVFSLILDLGIEHFDDVQIATLRQRLQHRTAHARTNRIEGMRRVHQAALCADAVHDLRNRQHVRNSLRQKQADQLARWSADLFADDDAHAELAPQRGQGGFNAVMIGDTHHIQTFCFNPLGQLVERGARISRRSRVEMTIQTNPAARGWWRRPNGTQQQKGD